MKTIDDRLEKLLHAVAPELSNYLIYGDGSEYVLYDQYSIIENSGCYTVKRISDGRIHQFSRLKTAASWAILDKYNKIIEAKRILELDNLISAIDAELLVNKKLQKRGPLESREISRDKYLVNIDKQKRFKWELDKYIMVAKKCQDKGYQNELTGTPRK